MNNDMREIEDSSDDFFQSKHVNKRKEDFEREKRIKKKNLKDKKKKAILILKSGLERTEIAYKNKDWKDEKEKLSLRLLSKLHVANRFYRDEYQYGYFLLNNKNRKSCFYNLKSNTFWLDESFIWSELENKYDMSYYAVQLLIHKILAKYFELFDIRVRNAYYLWLM